MDVWKELHMFSAARGVGVFDAVGVPLFGDVPWSIGADGKSVSHIPLWLSKAARQNGFEIVAADWKRDCYTLSRLQNKGGEMTKHTPYTKPHLTVYGRIADLTRVAGASGGPPGLDCNRNPNNPWCPK